ncbi:hypothetical protein GS475_02710 [Rhodococcus hoagii]|nr:hypothetical protein [Prescottella equi]
MSTSLTTSRTRRRSGEYFTDNLHLNNKGHRKAGYVIGDGLRLSSNTWPAIPATAALPSVNPTVPDITSELMAQFTFDLGLTTGASVPSVAPVGGSRGISSPTRRQHRSSQPSSRTRRMGMER